MAQPCFNLDALQARAQIYKQIRTFFESRDVLEVETPSMTPYTVTDPHVSSLAVTYDEQAWYLQTSPEYMMKQLITMHQKDIYQICKAYRNDQFGAQHQPEFTMLEWYRMGFDYQTLMQEVVALVRILVGELPVVYVSYATLFEEVLGVNPLNATCDELAELATLLIACDVSALDFTLTDWQQLLFSFVVEPTLKNKPCVMVYDFPISHSSLAKPCKHDPRLSARFELFLNGVECANGFEELTDAGDCERRFKVDLAQRQRQGLPLLTMDAPFLEAMHYGMPKCAGVSLGLDRILMHMLDAKSIDEVIPRAFNFVDAAQSKPSVAV
jgi:lysyl-tRNA synthetase class 2